MTAPLKPTRVAAAWVSLGLSVIGLLLSIYLAYEYLTGSATLACIGDGAIDCVKVTTSQWAVIAGVPVSFAGVAYFLAMTLLCVPYRGGWDLGPARLIGAVIGTAMVLWLIFVELFLVDAICLWCTGVHLVTMLLFGSVLWWRESDRSAHRRS